MKVRVFFSYSTKDKHIVGDLIEYFDAIGLEVFAAHDTLELSAKFEQRILDELRQTDVFIALVTKRFRESLWTDQEFGVALAGDKVIIPLMFRASPHGFLKQYNYKRLNRRDLRETVVEVATAIAAEQKLKRRFRQNLVKGLKDKSKYDYNRAIAAARVIEEIEGFTDNEMNLIIKGTIANDQIHGSHAFDSIASFCQKNKSRFSPTTLRTYKSISPWL